MATKPNVTLQAPTKAAGVYNPSRPRPQSLQDKGEQTSRAPAPDR